MLVVRASALVLALLAGGCGREVTIDRSDASSSPGATSGGAAEGSGGSTHPSSGSIDPSGGGGAGGVGGADGTGGSAPAEPPVDWPLGPGDAAPPRSACAWRSEVTESDWTSDDPAGVTLVPRDDGTFRVVHEGRRQGRRMVATGVDVPAWDASTWRMGGWYTSDGAAFDDEALLPLAARGDVTAHVLQAGLAELRVRELEVDPAQRRLRTHTNRYHELPDVAGGVRALGLVAPRTAAIAHGTAGSLVLSRVHFAQDPPYRPALVEPIGAPPLCADRPVAVTFTPSGDATLLAVSSDGSTCEGTARAPTSVLVGLLDASGDLTASRAIDLGAAVEELWMTAAGDARWIAIRVEGWPNLLLGRIDDDARVEPIAQIPAGTEPSLAAWRDGIAVLDRVDGSTPRLRLVDREGRIVDRAPVLPDVGRAIGRGGVLASPDGRAVAVAIHDDVTGEPGYELDTRLLLLRADCDL